MSPKGNESASNHQFSENVLVFGEYHLLHGAFFRHQVFDIDFFLKRHSTRQTWGPSPWPVQREYIQMLSQPIHKPGIFVTHASVRDPKQSPDLPWLRKTSFFGEAWKTNCVQFKTSRQSEWRQIPSDYFLKRSSKEDVNFFASYSFSHNHESWKWKKYLKWKETNIGDIPFSTEPWLWEKG